MTDSCVGATGTNDITDSRYLCLFHPPFFWTPSLSFYLLLSQVSVFLPSSLHCVELSVRVKGLCKVFWGVSCPAVGRKLLASLQGFCTKAAVHQQYPKMSKAPSSHVLNAFSTTLKLKSPNKRKWLKTIHCTKYPSHQF